MKGEIAPAVEATVLSEAETSVLGDLVVLTKARLNLLMLITTFVGFCLASPDVLDWLRLFHTLLGTALVAGAAAILNQAIEVRVDRLMERTRARPLAAGRWRLDQAIVLGAALGAVGLAYLAFTTNSTATALAAATLVIYLAIYTPMKRIRPFCVTVGAVSGAIPPVIGWTAAGASVNAAGAWILFGVLFLWQIPHFLAIAWMYRDEYAQAGFRMVSASDTDGARTAWRSLLYAVALTAVTLLPFFLGWSGLVYVGVALVINGVLLYYAVRFLADRSRASARRLFFSSIIYLPVILGLMIFVHF